jgi:Protein of unknown function (DUF3168)
MPVNAQWALQKALLAMLNADATLNTLFGTPIRLHDDIPTQPVFPFATFDRAGIRSVNADLPGAFEHQMTLKVWSHYGGRREALEGLHALRSVIDASLSMTLDDHYLINIRTVFADVFRVRNSRTFEAILNLRALTEPINP